MKLVTKCPAITVTAILLRGALAVLLLIFPVLASAVLPDATGTVRNADGTAFISVATPHAFGWGFLDTDYYSSDFNLSVRPEHRGRIASVFLGGIHEGRWYLKTYRGWEPWNDSEDAPTPLSYERLGQSVHFEVFDHNQLPPGQFDIYAAYLVEGAEPVISAHPLRFMVQGPGDEALHRFHSPLAMESYLKQGLQNSTGNINYLRAETERLNSATTTDGAAPRVSTTNLQVSGVDEADTVKTDGEHLFILRDCLGGSCLVSYALDGANAEATELASIRVGSAQPVSGLYLAGDRDGPPLLITLAGGPGNYRWFDLWAWGGNQTDIEFFDTSNPANLVSLASLRLDGQLISSRRIGDTLYIVTRFTPGIAGYARFAFDSATVNANDQVLQNTDLEELLPQWTMGSQPSRPLVNASSCYLQTRGLDRGFNPSFITVTAIPLAAPENLSSTCFLGETETLYMTQDALYLATTRYSYYGQQTGFLLYEPQHSTAIHKFILDGQSVTYRGSGSVRGHLGWAEDKKSFRMGENGEYLNVVSSLGETWFGNSSTRLTVLKDDGIGNLLQPVSVIDGIGKPGEQLYAARFLGDRAYLVTFRLIDPLYVIDLSNQEKPVIAGELEIDGYSDYLHPVSGTLLLGIGKDAIPDNGSSDFGGGRGAWYQGLKLSLFDVADPSSPVEIESLVIGKRGTDSAVLSDHHALAFLPATANQPARLSIPVQLHDRVPAWPWFDPARPDAYYDYTHSGLYSFELSPGGLEQVGRLLAEDDENLFWYQPGSDRAVLLDDAVFYIRRGKVSSSFWGEDSD